jgi:hypothetical protein
MNFKEISAYYEAEIKACKSQIEAMEIMISNIAKIESYKLTKHLTNFINERTKIAGVSVHIDDTYYSRYLKLLTRNHSVDYDSRAYYSNAFREINLYIGSKQEYDKDIEEGQIRSALLSELKRARKELNLLERNNNYDILRSKEERRKEIENETERFNESLDSVSRRFLAIKR